MNDVIGYSIIVSIVVAITLILVFRFTKMKKIIRAKYDPRNEVLNPNGEMKIWTINGIGLNNYGHFRDNGDTFVTYQFLSFVFPIFPIGAYRIREIDYGQKYQVYGSVKPFLLEVIDIYIKWYILPIPFLIAIISIIFFVSYFTNNL